MLLAGLALAACSNSDKTSTTANDTTPKPADTTQSNSQPNSQEKVTSTEPGVTDTEIQVSGIASVENPLGGSYAGAFDGVEAYFKMVNEEQGGIYGRKLVLKNKHDDKFSNNKQEVSAVLSQDKPFAVLPVATILFTGADDLVAANMPTFGWGVDRAWIGTPDNKKLNMFTQSGFLCFDCASPGYAWISKAFDAHKVGVLAYSAEQSATCADGMQKSYDTFGKAVDASVVFLDKALQYGEKNFSTQVTAMKDKGVDLVLTCMDTNAVIALAQEMKSQQLDAKQYLPNGYDQALIDEYGDLLEGDMVRTDFVGFESPFKPKGLENYLKWMDATGATKTENSVAGWLNADLFVTGLRAAGPNFTQQKLMDSINAMDNYDADGFLHGVNWTVAHYMDDKPWLACSYAAVIENSKLVSKYVEGDKAFVCADGKDPSDVKISNEG